MLLANKIEFLLLHVDFISSYWKVMSPIARRMYAIGFINGIHQIVSQLIEIDELIDTSLGFEDAYLEYPPMKDKTIKFADFLNERMYDENPSKDSEISSFIDFFPLDEEAYTFSAEKADTFKTGMQYLCSEANLSPRDIVFALKKGIDSMFKLMYSIHTKKAHIEDYQWEDFWNSFQLRDDDLYIERAYNDYDEWKEEHDYQDIQTLKDKREQEILKMLKSGIFSHDVPPTRREIVNSTIRISEDALEDGTDLPANISGECARMSRYVTMKDDILCLDYVKLGKYIYKHYPALKDEEGDSLIYFDYILNKIHEDMGECDPKLKKYLKFYEEDQLEDLLKNAQYIINSCKSCLSDNVNEDFLVDYMRATFYGSAKAEVQKKLKGQSKYTLICYMLAMLKNAPKVFRVDVSSDDLAQLLALVVKEQNEGVRKKYPQKDSLKRYIDKGATIRNSKLSIWTTQYVTDALCNNQERLFMKIAQK